MTSIASVVGKLAAALRPADAVEHPAEYVAAPESLEQAAQLLRAASDEGIPATFWGAGTHQGIGYDVEARLAVSTSRMAGVVDWQPEDMTVVVGPGTRVADLDDLLASRNQTAVLPERDPAATIGGVVAAGLSGLRRLRYGPTRDRVLETTVVTGDGRIVRAGGRVVKNVTGYDMPRLMTGSYGALGLIGPICLKLWPTPEASATVVVDDLARALATAYRPLAVLDVGGSSRVYLSGTLAEVEGQAADLNGAAEPGLHWPERPDLAYRIAVRVPPALTAPAVARLQPLQPAHYEAAYGVGEVTADLDVLPPDAVAELRGWAERAGGALVVLRRPAGEPLSIDPWGRVPASLKIQRRVKAAFDPIGICNPGRLPGGL